MRSPTPQPSDEAAGEPAMILVAGGSGTLGSVVVGHLAALGLPLRVLTRQQHWTGPAADPPVEVVVGDVRDPAILDQALAGATVVVSCIQGFGGRDPQGLGAVDVGGNKMLVDAAQAHGVVHLVLLSVVGASATSPMPLFRAKFRAEEALRASSVPHTIIRAGAFMETWLQLVGDPLVERGRTTVFGRGENPINFVAVREVAQAAERAVLDRQPSDRTISVTGPDNLTFNRFAELVLDTTGRQGRVSHVPRPALRALAIALRPIKPMIAQQVKAAVVMDTEDMTAPTTGCATPLTTVISDRYGDRRFTGCVDRPATPRQPLAAAPRTTKSTPDDRMVSGCSSAIRGTSACISGPSSATEAV